MKRTYGIIFLVLILTLGLFAYGCGADDDPASGAGGNGDEADETGETGDDQEDGMVEVNNWIVPDNFGELLSTFSELKYCFITDGQEMTMQYVFLESEEVDGVQTDKTSVSIDDDEIIMWVDADGEIRQLELEGQILAKEMTAGMGTQFTGMLLLPFQMVDGINIQEMLVEPAPGYSVELVSTDTEAIGDLTATVSTIEMIIGPPVAPSEVSYVSRIADFGDFQTMLSWEVTEGDGETFSFGFEIQEIVLR